MVWGNRHSHALLEGQQSGATAMEGNLTRSTKITTAVPSDTASLLPVMLFQACQVAYGTRVFTTAFFITAMGWEDPKCTATGD